MSMLAKNAGTGRIVAGIQMSYPCGNPHLSEDADLAVREKILASALQALQTDIDAPRIFKPDI